MQNTGGNNPLILSSSKKNDMPNSNQASGGKKNGEESIEDYLNKFEERRNDEGYLYYEYPDDFPGLSKDDLPYILPIRHLNEIASRVGDGKIFFINEEYFKDISSNHYKIKELQEQIKKIYRQLVIIVHPDKIPKGCSDDVFKFIHEIYEHSLDGKFDNFEYVDESIREKNDSGMDGYNRWSQERQEQKERANLDIKSFFSGFYIGRKFFDIMRFIFVPNSKEHFYKRLFLTKFNSIYDICKTALQSMLLGASFLHQVKVVKEFQKKQDKSLFYAPFLGFVFGFLDKKVTRFVDDVISEPINGISYGALKKTFMCKPIFFSKNNQKDNLEFDYLSARKKIKKYSI